MRPKPTARAEESLRFGHDLVPALRAMPGANPVPDTFKGSEVRQTQIAYKSYRTAIGAVVRSSTHRCVGDQSHGCLLGRRTRKMTRHASEPRKITRHLPL